MYVAIPNWVVYALAGAAGQLVRVLFGVKKAADAGEHIKISRIVWTTAYGMVSGAIIGSFYSDARLAFTSGLAMTDLTESLLKIASPAPAKVVHVERRKPEVEGKEETEVKVIRA